MDFVWRDDAGLEPRRGGVGMALKLLAALALGGFFLGLLLSTVALQDLAATLRRLRAGWLIGAALAVSAAYGLRAARWAVMLRQAGAHARFRDAAVPLLGSAALDNLLPLGAGDAVRVIALQSFPGRAGARPFGTLKLEKRLEVAGGAAVVLLAVLVWRPDRLEAALHPGILVGIAGAALAGAAAWAKPAGVSAGRIAGLAGLTLAVCAADVCACLAVAEALGLARAAPTATLAAGLIAVSRLLPAPPGRLGVFDYAAALSASAFGASAAQALAFALLSHAVVWVAITVVGWRLLASAARIGVARGPAMHPV